MENRKTALVLGATGGIGGAIAASLGRHGWHVRGMARDIALASKKNGGIDWVAGDAMVRSDVIAAAQGATLIVHAVNPPNYQNWEKLVLPMIDNTIAAAKATGARILLPGTIYNFDPATTPVINAETPQHPRSRKGAIRVELERRLQQAAPEVTSLILRAGDFFGPGARSSWFSQAMVAPGKPVQSVVTLTRKPGHSWAYLPDLAEAAARLVDRPELLLPFERVQFEGHYDATGADLVDAVQRVVGHTLPIRRFPWWAMRLLSPFGGFPREAAEIAQYWKHPVRLDNTRLVELIGPEPHTAIDSGIRAGLVEMDGLPHRLPAPAAVLAR